MTTRQTPICPTFNIPYFVISGDRLYLSGHSYYRLTEPLVADSKNQQPLSILFASGEESEAVPELRWAIMHKEFESMKNILNIHPALPRFLNTTRGKCDQELHELLFGFLLSMGRIRDLERLYGVVTSDGTSEDGEGGVTPPTKTLAIEDADEIPKYELISQRETFGSRAALVHEKICVRRSEHTRLITTWSPDPVRKYKITERFLRWPIRGIHISKILGKGSFGHVFESSQSEQQTGGGNKLLKYNNMTSEYVREFLSQCILSLTNSSGEIEKSTSASPDMIQNHILELTEMHPITRTKIKEFAEIANKQYCKEKLCFIDQISIILRSLSDGIRGLRDRFIMHLDISTTNVMWDSLNQRVRLIDYGGTIGDDSFFDIGTMVTRVCTRSTRPPEYASVETLWQRNESSETLSAYYSLMSHVFDSDLINEQPYSKDGKCSAKIIHVLETMDAERKDKPIPQEILCLRRIHQAARVLPRDRPSIDWLLSNGNDEEDRIALEMGCIGSVSRYIHVRQCLSRFVSKWPRGNTKILDEEWKLKRSIFISLLISRVDCSSIEEGSGGGVTCGGLMNKIIPPPYITVRCISLYDALRDIVLNSQAEMALVRYLTEQTCYPILVNAILYVSLASSKASLIDVEHYSGHPLHVIMRALLGNLNLTSVFLSPITVFSLLILETPRATDSDLVASEIRRSPVAPPPRPESSHRIIRCLYNLRKDRRCQPMCSSLLLKIALFTRQYMSYLMRLPLVIKDEQSWWKLLKIKGKLEGLEIPEGTPPLTDECSKHIDNVIKLWFT